MIRVDIRKNLHTINGMIQLNVAFQVESGEFVTLFGESGVGKTALLRMISGLTDPDEGRIEVDGEVWFDSATKTNWPVQKRQIGFVFQEHNLFPNMTVYENLRYALENKSKEALIEEYLSAMSLAEMRNRRPQFLSGGQKQRVALIRALLREPKLFLLDEPFSSLDFDLRVKLQNQVLKFFQQSQASVIFVSHDIGEVFKLSSRVLFIESGKIKTSGSPREVFAENIFSGKYQFSGTILDISRENHLCILTVKVGDNLTKIALPEEEVKDLHISDKVLFADKPLTHIIEKIHENG